MQANRKDGTAMDENEALRHIGTITLGDELYGQSVHELETRIIALKREVVRVETELDKKRQERHAADNLFGPKP